MIFRSQEEYQAWRAMVTQPGWQIGEAERLPDRSGVVEIPVFDAAGVRQGHAWFDPQKHAIVLIRRTTP